MPQDKYTQHQKDNSMQQNVLLEGRDEEKATELDGSTAYEVSIAPSANVDEPLNIEQDTQIEAELKEGASETTQQEIPIQPPHSYRDIFICYFLAVDACFAIVGGIYHSPEQTTKFFKVSEMTGITAGGGAFIILVGLLIHLYFKQRHSQQIKIIESISDAIKGGDTHEFNRLLGQDGLTLT